MGKGFKKVLKGIGKVAGGALKIASPLAGLIPGVGLPLSAALGAGGNLLGRALSGNKTFGNIGQTLASGAGAAGSAALSGGQGVGGLLKSPALSTIGKTIGKTFTTPEGGLDLGRLAGVGMGVGNFLGQRAQRKGVEKRMGAEDDIRSQLLSRLLARPQYSNFPTGAQ